ncbi:MAG: ATP-dependent DNA ligase [Bacteroidota bacterium]|nr:ATP-dependent DNA ligase [Bacteroidota bacterium]MDX5505927.1 ATP-dependent DNA ligase [Bacteroidota bacterium]
MELFAKLFRQLDQTNKTNAKIQALVEYFRLADPKDALWAIAVFSGKRPKRSVNTRELREWAAKEADLPLWMLEETYHIVGDLSETLANIIPNKGKERNDRGLADWITGLKKIRGASDPDRKEFILHAWRTLDPLERFAFNKLITGGLRVGISQKNLGKALAIHTGQPANIVALRLMGNWDPESVGWDELLLEDRRSDDLSVPYPFFLAHPIEKDPTDLGLPEDWYAEHKWDGIRGQLIIRGGELFLWSRGEELVTGQFPELTALKDVLPDGTVLDGEILVVRGDDIGSFADLQKRLGRKRVLAKWLETHPVRFRAYDILEIGTEDIRSLPLERRRRRLEDLLSGIESPHIDLSPRLDWNTWEDLRKLRVDSRKVGSEGLMIKSRRAPYRQGRVKGDWWKWKVDPMVIDAVMIYAQRGHGRRANLYTDYTFAVWGENGELVPFAKAYSGLTDEEIREVDRFVKNHTRDRFGPVRSVEPQLVFEIAFEGIRSSNRHKSGVALRFPRINRWRKDKPVGEANTLQDLLEIAKAYG